VNLQGGQRLTALQRIIEIACHCEEAAGRRGDLREAGSGNRFPEIATACLRSLRDDRFLNYAVLVRAAGLWHPKGISSLRSGHNPHPQSVGPPRVWPPYVTD